MSGHAERTHRKYSPSQADRVALCPGSTKLLARVPARPKSQWAIEGEKAHTVLQAALDNRVRDARTAHLDYSELCMEPLDDRYGGEYNLFYHSINMMLDLVYEIMDQYPDAILWSERYVNVPSEAAPGEADGYCDCAIYVPSIRRLFVFDYKHGAGVTKAIRGNRQVLQYSAGVLYGVNEDGSQGIDAEVDTVTLAIVQPRAFHVDGPERLIDVSPWEVYMYLTAMDGAIYAAEADNAPLIPGDEQCQFCDAKVECPARQALALTQLHSDFRTVRDVIPGKLKPIDTLTPEDFAWGSHAFPYVTEYIEQFYERRLELIKAGVLIPGFKLVQVEARRQWEGEEPALAKKLSALTGMEPGEFYRAKFITITEAEALVKQAYRKAAGRGKKNDASEAAAKAMALLTTKQSSGNLTVVEENDPRPAMGTANFDGIVGLIEPPGEST